MEMRHLAYPMKERRMYVRAVVPFKWRGAKSRLHPFLSVREREELALCMLKDVLRALSFSYVDEVVLIVKGDVERLREEIIGTLNLNLEFREDARGLNEALKDVMLDILSADGMREGNEVGRNERASSGGVADEMLDTRLLVMMSDLPLVTDVQINDVLRCDEDIVIVPGRRGGTNAISLRHPDRATSIFRFNCGISFVEHMKCAESSKMSVCIYDSFLFSTDIDEVGDLIDLLVFGNGFASEYLRKIGVFISADKHVTIARRPAAARADERCNAQA